MSLDPTCLKKAGCGGGGPALKRVFLTVALEEREKSLVLIRRLRPE